jgi:steroid delta-isomerase-like uncharacterized protein
VAAVAEASSTDAGAGGRRSAKAGGEKAAGRKAAGRKAGGEKGDAAKPARPRATRPRRSAKQRQVEETARAYFDALAARDADRMASHWSDQGVDDIVPLAVLRGPDEVRRFFAELFAAFPDEEVTVRRVIGDERQAAVEWRITGTFTGAPFQGIEPTGRWLEVRGVDLLEVEDGKLLRNTSYYDGAAFARQIGMLPPQDSGAERAMKGAFNAYMRVRRSMGAG